MHVASKHACIVPGSLNGIACEDNGGVTVHSFEQRDKCNLFQSVGQIVDMCANVVRQQTIVAVLSENALSMATM